MITSALVLAVVNLHLHWEAHLQVMGKCVYVHVFCFVAGSFQSSSTHAFTTPAPHHVYGVFGRRMYLHVVSVVGVDALVILPVDRSASSSFRSCMRGNVQKFVHMLETVARHGFESRIGSRGMLSDWLCKG